MLDPSHFPYNVASGQMHSIFRQIHKLLAPLVSARLCRLAHLCEIHLRRGHCSPSIHEPSLQAFHSRLSLAIAVKGSSTSNCLFLSINPSDSISFSVLMVLVSSNFLFLSGARDGTIDGAGTEPSPICLVIPCLSK